MVEIKPKVRRILSGSRFAITKFPILEELKSSDSPLRMTTLIQVEELEERCSDCSSMGTNYCLNCNRPNCLNHSRAIFIKGNIASLCIDCANEILRKGRIIRL